VFIEPWYKNLDDYFGVTYYNLGDFWGSCGSFWKLFGSCLLSNHQIKLSIFYFPYTFGINRRNISWFHNNKNYESKESNKMHWQRKKEEKIQLFFFPFFHLTWKKAYYAITVTFIQEDRVQGYYSHTFFRFKFLLKSKKISMTNPLFILPSISPTFYARGFRTKFWCQKLQSCVLGLNLIGAKILYKKCMSKMLMQLTAGPL